MLELETAIQRARHYRNQLILLWDDQIACTQKLEGYAEQFGLTIKNLNLELSALLLEEPTLDRKRRSALVAEDWLRNSEHSPLLLSRIEFLFDSTLGVNPIKVLLNSSKNKTILAIWPGNVTSEQISYATPGHHEYKNYKLSDLGETILLRVSGD